MPVYKSRDVPLSEAQTLFTADVRPLEEAEKLPLADALGRICAQRILSLVDAPPFTHSAMDGFAFRYDELVDRPGPHPVAGEAYAGHPFEGGVPPRSLVRIMTGAPLPDGLDTVIPLEAVEVTPEGARFSPAALRPGANVRLQGEEVRAGDCVMGPGCLIAPEHVGLLASMGLAEVRVLRRLRAGVFSTGDELVRAGQRPGPGQRVDSNAPMLAARLRQWGCEVVDLGILPDDEDALTASLSAALPGLDLVVTTGGVGAGDKDYTAHVFARLGRLRTLTIAMRPGRPLGFADTPEGVRLVGLPGNPVAALMSAQCFILPWLRCKTGATERFDGVFAKAGAKIKSRAGRSELVRGTLRREAGENVFTPWPQQGSAMMTSVTRCNAVAHLPPESCGVEPGDTLFVTLL